MKRLLVSILLVLALVLPGTALGGSFFYKGPLQGGANNAGIAFRIKFKNHKPRKVLRIEFFNVAAPPCYYSYGPVAPGWKVNRKNKFHGTLQFNGGNATASVTGKVKSPRNHWRKVVGTFRAHGPSSCDTGTLNYVAKRP
jgi:hypothetical protein